MSTSSVPAFARYIDIDYSGAETPTSSLKGLRVYFAQGDAAAEEVLSPPSPRKYWTQRGIAEWLCAQLAEDVPPQLLRSIAKTLNADREELRIVVPGLGIMNRQKRNLMSKLLTDECHVLC